MTRATRFAPQQLAGAAIMASLFVWPTSQGLLGAMRATGFGALVAGPTAVVLVTAIVGLFFFACFISGPIPPSARPRIFAILADPGLSIGAKLKATFTNWFSLLLIAAQLLGIALLVLP